MNTDAFLNQKQEEEKPKSSRKVNPSNISTKSVPSIRRIAGAGDEKLLLSWRIHPLIPNEGWMSN